MKKLFLISASLILSAVAGFGQALKPVAIDNAVTVSLPVAYQKTDTLGQQIYSSNSELGYVVVMRTPNAKATPLQHERDLDNVMKQNVQTIQSETQDASAQFVRDTTIGKLKAKTFTLQTDNGQGDIQLRNIVLLYTNAATYVFEYVYPNARSGMITGEYKSFVNSIKLAPTLDRHNQYLSNAKGFSVTWIIVIIGIMVLIVASIVWYRQRQKNLEFE
ncbi:hypothetical protein [Mucilaginibacter sp. dw_454]|uniref:hypothetical protein n=1 Tax=Mucilaginibacter sp. dw_454 TaxID=2720079 RepID=UPI001BD34B8D|nr:hypothetical protein [Mucilaginibacter sp. dw_454]